jgi:hypothetical protein
MTTAPLTVKLATYPVNVSQAHDSGCPFTAVEPVPHGQPADIEFKKHLQNYKDRSKRPYRLTQSRRSFATLKSAVAAYKAERKIG